MTAIEASETAVPEWFLVETLHPDTLPTVVADGGRRKNFASLRRVRPNLGVAAAHAFEELTAACRQTRTTQERVLSPRRGEPTRIIAIPVMTCTNDVLGVQMWAGPANQEPPPRRVAAASVWDFGTMIAHQGPGLQSEILGIPVAEQRPTMTATDFFQRVVRWDDWQGLMTLAGEFSNGASWEGEMALRHGETSSRRVQQAVRAWQDGDNKRIHSLHYDITGSEQPAPSLYSATMRAAAALADGGIGRISLTARFIYEWLTVPAAPLDRWERERPVLDPEGTRLLAQACDRLSATSEREAVSFRVSFPGSGWIDANALLTLVTRDFPPQGLIKVTLRTN